MEIFRHLFLQLAFTVGVIVIFGLLIALCRRMFCRILGDKGVKILLITGAIGTPIHELSHALACIIFGHKVVEMKLYQPVSADGTLGYVNHAYNPKNLYHTIGNFFIGIAPILGGSAVLLLLMSWLVPGTHIAFSGAADSIDVTNLGGYLGYFGGVLGAVFSPANLVNYRWWIFILLALMIASHMELSRADLEGSYKGLLSLALILLIVDTILSWVAPGVLLELTRAMMSFSGYIASFLIISAVFSLTLVAVAPLTKALTKRRG